MIIALKTGKLPSYLSKGSSDAYTAMTLSPGQSPQNNQKLTASGGNMNKVYR